MAKMKIRFGDFGKRRRGCHIEKQNDRSNDDKRVESIFSFFDQSFFFIGVFFIGVFFIGAMTIKKIEYSFSSQ